MFNEIFFNQYFLIASSLLPSLLVCIFSYLKNKNFTWILLTNLLIISSLWINDKYLYSKIISLIFIIFSFYSIYIKKSKISSIKFLFLSFIIILCLLFDNTKYLYLLYIVMLFLILISSNFEINDFYINTSLPILVYVLSIKNNNQLIANENLLYVFFILIILIQVKYIFVQNNFYFYFILPILILSAFYYKHLSIFIITLYFVARLLEKKKVNLFVFFILTLIGNNILIYTLLKFTNSFNSKALYYLEVSIIILLFSIIIENFAKFKMKFKIILYNFLAIIFILVPLYLIDVNSATNINIIFFTAVLVSVINSLFLKVFRYIYFVSFFDKIYSFFLKLLTKSFVKFFEKLFLIRIKFLKYRKNFYKLINKLLNSHYAFFINLVNIFKVLYKKTLYLIIRIITIIDNYIFNKAKYETIIFIFSFIILLIYISREVL